MSIYRTSLKRRYFFCRSNLSPAQKASVAGFTLIEIIVAVMILALLAAGLFSTIVSSRYLVWRSKKRLEAVEVARQEIESLRYLVRWDFWHLNNAGDPLWASGSWGAWDMTSHPPFRLRRRIEPCLGGEDCRIVTVEVRWDVAKI